MLIQYSELINTKMGVSPLRLMLGRNCIATVSFKAFVMPKNYNKSSPFKTPCSPQ